MKIIKIISLFAIFALFSEQSFALDLQSARAQALVGESNSGYIEKISGGKEVDELVAEVNEKRRAEYSRISNENGQSVDVVAKIAAENIIKNLPKSTKYKNNSGKWTEK